MTTSAVGAAADPPAPLGEPPSAHPEPARTDPRLSQVELPDGQRVFCVREREAASVYAQVRGYLKHGIHLEAGATVFDVGANIGLFTLLAHQLCRGDLRAFAFEPIPITFAALSANLARLGTPRVKALNCGLGRVPGTLKFAYYPNFTVLSTAYGNDMDELREDLKESFLRNLAAAPSPVNRLRFLPPFLRRRILEWKMAESFIAEEVNCPIRTVSDVIREEGVERIDLLKVDAEKSELDVLLGIDEEDWPKIHQAALEVHDLDSRLATIQQLLRAHGLARITVEQDSNLKGSRIFTLFALR